MSRYQRLHQVRANAGDWSIVNCACAIEFSGRKVEGAKIIFGAVANKAFVAEKAAAALVGTELDETALDLAVEALDKELVDPTSDSKARAPTGKGWRRCSSGDVEEGPRQEGQGDRS